MFRWFDVMIKLSFNKKKSQKLCLIFKKNVNIKNYQFKYLQNFHFFLSSHGHVKYFRSDDNGLFR